MVCLSFVIVELLLSLGVAEAGGTIGVGIQAAPLKLAITAQPSHTYDFPTVYVVNNGTEPITARFTLEPLNKGAQHVAPVSWISFPRQSIPLRPGASAHFPVTLHVPGGADTGTYLGDVVVHATSVGTSSGTGAQVSAGAATKIEFTVGDADFGSSGGVPNWVLPAVIVIAVILVLFLLWRAGIRVTLSKRP
jgi:hypothetical protein